jgi:hypothetical protein
MKYLTCIQNIASVIILYYLYKNVTAINSNIDTIKQELTTEEDTTTLKEDEIVETEEDKVPYLQTTSIEFNYTCCEPIFVSTELSTLLDIKKQICNFYELISKLNNYLYEHNLLELQHVTLTKSLKYLVNTEHDSLPYHKFIEFVLDKHVQKYI